MVTCKIDTNRVSRFARSEALPTRTIFAETRFTYDEKFWGNFNMIPPEEKLNDAIGFLMIDEFVFRSSYGAKEKRSYL